MKRIIGLIIGALFIASGVFKLIDSKSFAELMVSYNLAPLQNLSPFISGLEIFFGLCLILQIKPALTSLLIMIITVVFTIAFSYAYFFKGIEDCGCMGTTIKIPAYLSFIRNLLIIAGCFWIWRGKSEPKPESEANPQIPEWKLWTVFSITAISMCIAGSTLGKPLVNQKELTHAEPFNQTLFMQYFKELIPADQTKIFFLFGPNCEHCWNATENVKSIKLIPEFANITAITFDDEDMTSYLKEMQPNFDIMQFPRNELSNLIREVPILVVLQNGRIKYKFMSGQIPCGQMLKKMIESEK